MLTDSSQILSAAQAVTATAYSTNVIDRGPIAAFGYAGAAETIPILLDVETTFTAGGSATMTIQVLSGTSATAGSGTVVLHYQSFAIPVASLVAGADINRLFRLGIPTNCGRYVYLQYVIATGPMTAGAITAKVAMTVPTQLLS